MTACWAHILAPSFLVIGQFLPSHFQTTCGTLSRSFQDFFPSHMSRSNFRPPCLVQKPTESHTLGPQLFCRQQCKLAKLGFISDSNMYQCTGISCWLQIVETVSFIVVPRCNLQGINFQFVVFWVTSNRCGVDQVFSASFYFGASNYCRTQSCVLFWSQAGRSFPQLWPCLVRKPFAGSTYTARSILASLFPFHLVSVSAYCIFSVQENSELLSPFGLGNNFWTRLPRQCPHRFLRGVNSRWPLPISSANQI